MAYVEVDVDIDEFDTSDLVNEVVKRMKQENRKKLTAEQKKRIKDEYLELHQAIKLIDIDGIDIKTLVIN